MSARRPNPVLFLVTPFGRLTRRTFWILTAACFVAQIAIDALLGSAGLMYFLMQAAAGWIATAALTRRLHDFNQNAFGYYLGWTAVTVIALFLTMAAHAAAPPVGTVLVTLIAILATVIPVGFLIWAGSRPGDAHRNSHGLGGSALPSEASQPTGYLTP